MLQVVLLLTKGKREQVPMDVKSPLRLPKNRKASDLTTQERILAMDVLHFLRSNHEKIRAHFERVDLASPKEQLRVQLDDVMRAVEIHFSLEQEYLYPEISGSFHGVEVLLTAGLANASVVDKRSKALIKLLSHAETQADILEKSFFDLKTATYSHFEQEERILLPKMREFVRTEDREDLGQILMDVQEELWNNRSEVLASSPSGRLRA